jgi:hypothetical protein
MLTRSEPEFVARSRARLWPVFILVPCIALLTWMGFEALKPEFAAKGRGGFLNALDPEVRAAFFFGCALICALCVAVVARRRLAPIVEVEIDREGIASHLFWGRGRLAWNEITALETKGNWLFVHGRRGSGRPVKLIIDSTGLDQDRMTLLSHIGRYRPDLVGFPGIPQR